MPMRTNDFQRTCCHDAPKKAAKFSAKPASAVAPTSFPWLQSAAAPRLSAWLPAPGFRHFPDFPEGSDTQTPQQPLPGTYAVCVDGNFPGKIQKREAPPFQLTVWFFAPSRLRVFASKLPPISLTSHTSNTEALPRQPQSPPRQVLTPHAA